MTSICDSCFLPGYCCRNIRFFGTADGEAVFWLDELVEEQVKACMRIEDVDRPMPFRVQSINEQWVDDETQRPYGRMTFSCVNLLQTGRCGDYENRPQLCRQFEPARDAPCIHVGGSENGDHYGDEVIWDMQEDVL